MAIYSCNLRSIGRTTHQPGTAGAHIRYISRSEAHPSLHARHMPADRRKARNWIDRHERALRKNGRVIDKLRIALPRELSEQQRAQLISTFMIELTADRVPWFAAIHQTGKDALNPHVHIALHDRDIDTGKRVLRLSDNARDRQKAGLPGPKAVDWLRECWEIAANRALERAGQAARIDRRTLKDQGIDRAPTIHEGPRAATINDTVQRPQSRKRVNGCGRIIDYPSIDQGRTRREFNAHIIDLNLAKAAATSKNPAAVIWAQFEREEAAKDNTLTARLAAEQRKRTAERRNTSLLYRIRIKRLIAQRNLKDRAAKKRLKERFAIQREALRIRHKHEREKLKARQRRFSLAILRMLDFTGNICRRHNRARRDLIEEHKSQRRELTRRHHEAQKQSDAYIRAFYEADIQAQRRKRRQHLAQLQELHAQAQTFIQHNLQQREIEREHMRRIIQRKIEAWQAAQNAKKHDGGDDGSDDHGTGGGISATFARAILSAARAEVKAPKTAYNPGDHFTL